VRLIYDGKSVLFTGDTIWREIDGAPDQHKAAEREMVEWNPAIPLESDVIIAPHHGGDNASSMKFIQAVDPDFVVVSAGNLNDHPRAEVAERYLTEGVVEDHIFRTDRGSTKGGKEWLGGHRGHVDTGGDKSGDDDVEVFLHKQGMVEVVYRTP
jgi:beta-lactamase superfamily II metal-dependent hydrolase